MHSNGLAIPSKHTRTQTDKLGPNANPASSKEKQLEGTVKLNTEHHFDQCLISMILPTYPGKIPQTSPNPQKERNPFINCWWNVWGIFQGYVGEILDHCHSSSHVKSCKFSKQSIFQGLSRGISDQFWTLIWGGHQRIQGKRRRSWWWRGCRGRRGQVSHYNKQELKVKVI